MELNHIYMLRGLQHERLWMVTAIRPGFITLINSMGKSVNVVNKDIFIGIHPLIDSFEYENDH
jgi:hypothetical protein